MVKFLSVPAALMLIACPVVVLLDPLQVANWTLGWALLLTGGWLLYLGMSSAGRQQEQQEQ